MLFFPIPDVVAASSVSFALLGSSGRGQPENRSVGHLDAAQFLFFVALLEEWKLPRRFLSLLTGVMDGWLLARADPSLVG